MSLDFVAIDFETANAKRGSVIQIGVAKVRNGRISKTACLPIMPPPGLANFAHRNIQVHGLTPGYIKGASPWPDILDRLIRFSGDLPLVAHNASVERSCIVQASEGFGIEAPEFTYLCTQAMAKKRVPDAPSFGLEPLAELLNLPTFAHHDAGADALATAHLVLTVAERSGASDTAELWATVGALKPSRTQSNSRQLRKVTC